MDTDALLFWKSLVHVLLPLDVFWIPDFVLGKSTIFTDWTTLFFFFGSCFDFITRMLRTVHSFCELPMSHICSVHLHGNRTLPSRERHRMERTAPFHYDVSSETRPRRSGGSTFSPSLSIGCLHILLSLVTSEAFLLSRAVTRFI